MPKRFTHQILISKMLFLHLCAEGVIVWLFLRFNPQEKSINFSLTNSLIIWRALTIILASIFWYKSIQGASITEIITFAFLIIITTMITAVVCLREKVSSIIWLTNG